jgi:hypothetical protein
MQRHLRRQLAIAQDSEQNTISEFLVSIGRAFKDAWEFRVSRASLCISLPRVTHELERLRCAQRGTR